MSLAILAWIWPGVDLDRRRRRHLRGADFWALHSGCSRLAWRRTAKRPPVTSPVVP